MFGNDEFRDRGFDCGRESSGVGVVMSPRIVARIVGEYKRMAHHKEHHNLTIGAIHSINVPSVVRCVRYKAIQNPDSLPLRL
jgi:hypothetical protein